MTACSAIEISYPRRPHKLVGRSLASLEGEISQVQTIGTHLVYLVEIRNITLSPQGHGLIYFKRRFHPVMMEMEVAV